MTCIVAFSDSKSQLCWIGADSESVSSSSMKHTILPAKIWRRETKEGPFLFGHAGSTSALQIVRDSVDFPHDVDLFEGSPQRFLIRNWIPELIERGSKLNALKHEDGRPRMGGSFIICFKGMLLHLLGDFSLNHSADAFLTDGSGGEVASGIMWALTELKSTISPEERIRFAIAGASDLVSGVGGRIDILSA